MGGMHSMDAGLSGRPDRPQPRQPGRGHDRRLLPAQSGDAARISDARGIRRSASAAPSRAWKNWWTQQKIRWYGAATWDGFRKKGALEPAADGGDRAWKRAARSTTSASSSFRSIWGWWKRSWTEAGERAGSGGAPGHRGGRQRHALQTQVLEQMPEAVARTAARARYQRAARHPVHPLHARHRGGAGGHGPPRTRAGKPRRGAGARRPRAKQYLRLYQ